jgi:hypothetical protein
MLAVSTPYALDGSPAETTRAVPEEQVAGHSRQYAVGGRHFRQAAISERVRGVEADRMVKCEIWP